MQERAGRGRCKSARTLNSQDRRDLKPIRRNVSAGFDGKVLYLHHSVTSHCHCLRVHHCQSAHGQVTWEVFVVRNIVSPLGITSHPFQ